MSVCVRVLVCLQACACSFACVCVLLRMDAYTLGEVSAPGTDREGIELKRMRQIPPVTRSLIHTAIVLKSRVRERCHVVR